MKKKVAIMFGGDSAEHEVSVITGLQVVENIDKDKYEVYPIYMKQDSTFYLLDGLKSRKEFLKAGRSLIKFGKDSKGSFIQKDKMLAGKTYLDSVYLAFHGGSGEGGQVQGLLDTLKLPYTSPDSESSILTMNKTLTKVLFDHEEIPSVPGVYCFSDEIQENVDKAAEKVLKDLDLPLIIKPAHFGSSIGIEVVKNEAELKKALLQSSYIDREILVEKFIKKFVEYNVSARKLDGKIELSEIEKPVPRDEILSFADKYQRGGGKKNGNADGMASLERELPADISKDLKNKLVKTAKKAFEVCRCKGMVRIDFMVVDENEFYLTEINSIPGSMSFFLWEPLGITFQEQITDLIEQSIKDKKKNEQRNLEYKTDIVEKFVNRG